MNLCNINILYIIVGASILLNIILVIKVIQLQRELEELKRATRLTKEEVEKLNERIKKLKLGGGL
ncbi:hypothetical protein [Methanocaldococcus sp.]